MNFTPYSVLTAVLLFTACTDELALQNGTPSTTIDDIPNTGIEVNFGGVSQDAMMDAKSIKVLSDLHLNINPETRVNYNDFENTLGKTLSIAWESADSLSIIQVAQKSDGTVVLNSDRSLTAYKYKAAPNKNDVTKADFSSVYPTGSSIEQAAKYKAYWYSGVEKSRFYGVYPEVTKDSLPGIKMVYPYLNSDGTLNETKKAQVVIKVPKDQRLTVGNTYKIANSDSVTVFKIDSKNVYLFGMSDPINASDFSTYGNKGYSSTTGFNRVKMNFKPIMTTLTIGVRGSNSADVDLKELRVYLKDKQGNTIAFPDEITVNWTSLPYKQNGVGKMLENLCEVDESKNVYSGGVPYIRVIGSKSQLSPNQTAVYTVMLPPLRYDQMHYQLYIEPIYNDDIETFNTITLGNKEFNTVIPSSKIALNTKQVKVISFKFDSANWMSLLKDETPLSALSIPGAHSAGQISGKTTDTNSPLKDVDTKWWDEPFRQAKQVATIEEMLNAGVRAFDIRPNAEVTSPANVSYYGTVEPNIYTVDGTSGNKIFILDAIKKWLINHPKEGVIVLANRERTSSGRNPGPEAIKNIIENYDHVLVNNQTPLSVLRGKIGFFILRDSENTLYWGKQGVNYKAGHGYINLAAANYWEYEKHDGELKTQTYYGYQAPGATATNTSFEKVNINYSSNPNDNTNVGIGYFLRYDILGSFYNDNRPKPTFIVKNWGDNWGQSATSVLYDGESGSRRLAHMKDAMTIDFMRMATDWDQQSQNLFFTYVPYYQYYGSRLDADKDEKRRKENSWANLYEFSHKPVLDYIREHNDKRYGIMFCDFLPGAKGTTDFKAGDKQESYNEFHYKPVGFDNSISKEITRLLIISNYKRGWQK